MFSLEPNDHPSQVILWSCSWFSNNWIWFSFFIIYFGSTGSLLQHMGTRALEHVGWVVVVYGLRCPMACTILVPPPPARDQTWTPCLESSVLSTGPPGKSLNLISFWAALTEIVVMLMGLWSSILGGGGFPSGLVVKNLPAIQDTWVLSLGQEDPLEEGLATHSSILAWRIPWTEEPGKL